MTEKDKEREKGPGLSRRDAIAAGGAAAGLFILGAAADKAAGSGLIRPPGGQDKEKFLSRCIRCDRCRSVCPTGAISVSGIADGLAGLRTPVMDFRFGHCDFCRKCIEVCPTGALEDFEGPSVNIGLAKITDTCIALRTGGCTKCYEECPEEAIIIDPKKCPIIVPQLCNGCGYCVLICPANVFQSFSGAKGRGVVIEPRNDGGAK